MNPLPEEYPSAGDQQPNAPVPTSAVERETCGDNPLLSGCSLPDQDINANPISPPADPAENLEGASTPEFYAPDSAAAGDAGDAGDAGIDPADAGAP